MTLRTDIDQAEKAATQARRYRERIRYGREPVGAPRRETTIQTHLDRLARVMVPLRRARGQAQFHDLERLHGVPEADVAAASRRVQAERASLRRMRGPIIR